MSESPNRSTRRRLGWSEETQPSRAVGNSKQWWRNEATGMEGGGVAVQSVDAVEPVEVDTIDIWQELEEEALRRATSNAVEQLVEIYPKPEIINERMLKRMLYASVFITVAMVVQAVLMHNPMPLALVHHALTKWMS